MKRPITHKLAVFMLLSLLLVSRQGFTTTLDPEDEGTVWRFSHFLPANHSVAKAFSTWAKELQLATNNKLTINIYPASQLGSATDQYDMVRTRVAHLAWIVPGYEQGRFPVFSLLETPFLINDAVAGARSFHQWYGQYSAVEMKSVLPCLVTTSPPGRLSFKSTAVTHPDQIRGQRIRVSNATVGRYIRSLGGVTINIPVGDIRHALERSMIDALRFDFYSLNALSLNHLLVNHLDLLISSAPALVGINRESLAELPHDVRQTVMNFCSSDWSGKIVEAWQTLDTNALKSSQNNKKHLFHKPSASELTAWLAMTQPLIDEWKLLAHRKGLTQPQDALDKLRYILQTNSAEFSIQK